MFIKFYVGSSILIDVFIILVDLKSTLAFWINLIIVAHISIDSNCKLTNAKRMGMLYSFLFVHVINVFNSFLFQQFEIAHCLRRKTLLIQSFL